MKYALVELGGFNRPLEQAVDFFAFNPYRLEVGDTIKRYVVTDKVGAFNGVECVKDYSRIHGYDDITLFGIDSGVDYQEILQNNARVRARIYDNSSSDFVGITNIFSTDQKFTHDNIRVDYAELKFTFGFTDPKRLPNIDKKKTIVFNAQGSVARELTKYINILKELKSFPKPDFKILVIGRQGEMVESALESSGFKYSILEELTLFNVVEILHTARIVVDLHSQMLNSLQLFTYREETVYYGDFDKYLVSNLEDLTQEEFRKILLVDSFSREKVELQLRELEELFKN